MSETIIMVHGMMSNGVCWDNYKKFFEEKGYNCLAPTLRFHDKKPGEMPDPRLAAAGLSDYVDDIEKEIKKLTGLPIIMGHSMGGLIAQILGSRGLAKALVLLAPAAPYGILVLNYSVIKTFSEVIMRWGFWKKPFRLSFNKAVYSILNMLSGEEQQKTYENFLYESGLVFSQIGFWMLDPTKASKVDHKKMKCPVLIISGQEDRIIPAAVVKKVANKYKSVSTYKEFPKHAHAMIYEPGWEEIAEYIFAWLETKKQTI